MKFLSTLVAATLVAPFMAAADPTGCDGNEEVLKFSVVTSLKGHPKGEAAMTYAAAINEQLNGSYCIEVYGNSELYDDAEGFVALEQGDLHFAAPSLAKFGDYTQKMDLFNLPFLFDGPLHALEFLQSDEVEQLSDEVTNAGFPVLSYWSNGMRQFSATVPMRRPGDAEGLTFRVSSSSPITAAVLDTMGITPKKLSFSKVYDALASGEVQGQENTWANIATKEFYRVQAAVTESNHTYLGYAMITSQRFLDSLDPETRAVFVDTAKLVAHERNRFAFELNQQQRQNILDDDGIILRLTPTEMQEWRDAFAPILERFKPSIGAELVETAVRINAEADPFN